MRSPEVEAMMGMRTRGNINRLDFILKAFGMGRIIGEE